MASQGITIQTGLLLVLIAGIINGSFASPIVFIKGWKEENSWFIYGIWAFLILPVVTIFMLNPSAILTFKYLTHGQLAVVLMGGLAFGAGQVFLTTAFKCLGIGLSFIINIGIGTMLTCILSIYFSPHEMTGNYYYFRIIASTLLLITIIIAILCLLSRDKITEKDRFNENFTGIICAIVAGLGSGAQGLSFVYINPVISAASIKMFKADALTADILTWVLIFSFSSIPFILYFLYKIISNKSLKEYNAEQTGKNIFLTLCMALCFWLSLTFLARANSFVVTRSSSYQTSLWAIFMVFIILTSTSWSFKLKEWEKIPSPLRLILWMAILIFIIAIIIISLSIDISVAQSIYGKF